jgi:hypothetical protein
MLPVIITLVKMFNDFNLPLLMLTAFYIIALILGIIGAIISVNSAAMASKMFVVAIIFAILGMLLNLFLLLSLEGSYVRMTAMGIILLVASSIMTNKNRL